MHPRSHSIENESSCSGCRVARSVGLHLESASARPRVSPGPALAFALDGNIRIGPITAIPQVLRRLGVDPAEVMAAVGLAPDLFDDPDRTLPFALIDRLLQACAAWSQCPHFGLLVGMQASVSSMGFVGQLMRHAQDVGTALANLVLYLQLQDRGAVPTLATQSGMVFLGYAVCHKELLATDQIYDTAVAVGCNLMRELCGPRFRPSGVLLRHALPRNPEPYERFFSAPVRFDADQSALVFPAIWLDQPIRGADARLYSQLRMQAEVVMERMAIDWDAQLRRVLHGLVITGRGSVEQAAAVFGVHRRTLNRRLAARGTTFRTVLAEVRYEIAQQLLRDTRMPVVDIAGALGYDAAGAFTRAFQRWSGQSPQVWRTARTPKQPANR